MWKQQLFARKSLEKLLAEMEGENRLRRVLGPIALTSLGSDATATMSRAHAEIAHQIRLLGQLLDDIGVGPPDEVDLADLRSLLYGLHAIPRLHTAEEDESYLSFAEDQQAPPPARPPPAGLTRASAA